MYVLVYLSVLFAKNNVLVATRSLAFFSFIIIIITIALFAYFFNSKKENKIYIEAIRVIFLTS